jgi:hypothetical protein
VKPDAGKIVICLVEQIKNSASKPRRQAHSTALPKTLFPSAQETSTASGYQPAAGQVWPCCEMGTRSKEISMTTLAKICSATILVLALAAQASLAVAAQRAANGQAPEAKANARQLIQNCGNLPKTEVIVNGKPQSTDSTTFVKVEGSDLSLNIGGSTESCVIVSFSGHASAPGIFKRMGVRALLDNVPSIDGEITLVAESGSFFEAHAYNFLFFGVKPGLHFFRMEYRSANADKLTISDFNLNIRHR